MKNRIGLGYDIHRFGGTRTLYLGGVEIPSEQGLIGHSDADCLIHAIIDALLGAAGAGDIGRIFPDTAPVFKDARSTDLLAEAVGRINASGLKIVHVDTVVVAEEPKIGPHVPAMKKTLCPLLGVSEDGLGIKGKTNEGVGLIGQGEALACWAVALLKTRAHRTSRGKRKTPIS